LENAGTQPQLLSFQPDEKKQLNRIFAETSEHMVELHHERSDAEASVLFAVVIDRRIQDINGMNQILTTAKITKQTIGV
jgi:hypothetical protein